MIGKSLARPGDIDAVDGDDLIQTLLTQNNAIIDEKNGERERYAWVEEQHKLISDAQFAKAQAAYERMWARCANSKVGHDLRNVDVHGETMRVCRVCSVTYPRGDNPGPNAPSYMQSDYKGLHKLATAMNNDLVKVLADRMLELDRKAGRIAWVTEDDYPVKRRFGRR